MCGLNGVFAYSSAAPPVEVEELLRTRDHMAARGPDGAGMWRAADHRVGFGHRRLSIIDLSDEANQPMTRANGRFAIVFNGEIYNYRELRDDLKAAGADLRTHSDTEVILELYARHGEAALGRLRGMFAFAIWDNARRELFLARDPYGIKPLYFSDDGRTLRFASQVKALLAGRAIADAHDPAAQVGFYLWGNVPEPFTICRAIRALPAGSWMKVGPEGVRQTSTYHSIAAVFAEAEGAGETGPLTADQLRPLLLDSVRHHLVADVPVGAFLSAGIDSGALVGLMRDAGKEDIQTITLSFAEFQGRHDDEGPLAAEVARQYGARHTNRVVTESEFAADLPKILAAMDQPSIDGLNTWFVSKAARELGLKVAISGLGGDELLGGYPSFAKVPRWVARYGFLRRMPWAGVLSRTLIASIGPERFGHSPKAAGMFELGGNYPGAYLLARGVFMPWELKRVLAPEVAAEGLERLAPLKPAITALSPSPSSGFAKVAVLESALYMRNQLLRDTDWASMAHSLEVRTPLVDAVLLKGLSPILASPTYRPGKQALAEAPSLPLPQIIVGRAKTGFSTPIAQWLERCADGSPATRTKVETPWARRWAAQVAAAAA